MYSKTTVKEQNFIFCRGASHNVKKSCWFGLFRFFPLCWFSSGQQVILKQLKLLHISEREQIDLNLMVQISSNGGSSIDNHALHQFCGSLMCIRLACIKLNLSLSVLFSTENNWFILVSVGFTWWLFNWVTLLFASRTN